MCRHFLAGHPFLSPGYFSLPPTKRESNRNARRSFQLTSRPIHLADISSNTIFHTDMFGHRPHSPRLDSFSSTQKKKREKIDAPLFASLRLSALLWTLIAKKKWEKEKGSGKKRKLWRLSGLISSLDRGPTHHVSSPIYRALASRRRTTEAAGTKVVWYAVPRGHTFEQ